MEINSLFKAGSADLKEYLDENKVGNQMTAGNKTWTVKKVKVIEEVPPDMVTGEAQIQVTLVVI